MQNLTARYNILFNANDILAQKQEEYALGYVDAYDRFLSVYPDTIARLATPDKMLELVITKANTIIANKDQSHYLGDAYLILGKANYMEANFFNSIEFLNYVIRSYPKQKDLVQQARVWKARALMRIGQYNLADTTLDTALTSIFPKQKNIADVYATKLQYDLYMGKYTDAEAMAKQAIHYSRDVNHKLRWTFILAQVQEYTHKPEEAIANYIKVENSNASFEMSFNASLNRIRLQEKQNGRRTDRLTALRMLLKDDKNADFVDQIYYQIGELYLSQGNIAEAIKNYKLSIRKSTKNTDQKGLSYLRIADINFKDLANYPEAKKYYDSTLVSLSANYPGYRSIYKKANNLQLLTDRLQLIAREDTLQMLAKMSESDRTDKIAAMARARVMAQATVVSTKSTSVGGGQYIAQNTNTAGTGINGGSLTGTFYFYNSSAVSQGFTDFKRVWGNRQLADNWRRSIKSGNDGNNAQVAATIQDLKSNAYTPGAQKSTSDALAEKIKEDLLASIPLTPGQLQQSNSRILNAYIDIATFYRDILDDKKEAINVYLKIMDRYPDDPNLVSVYYNLYRLYSEIDVKRSNYYKDLILKKFPGSDFARVILDPDFNQKLNDKNAEYTAFYNQLFYLVSTRKYAEAATRAGEMIQQYPGNPLTAQVYYLRAIALGHAESADPFRAQLQEIADKFPEDRLITPLVKQHLLFMDDNKDELKQRAIVLIDSDPTEIPFLLRPIPVDRSYIPKAQIAVTKPKQAPVKTTVPAKNTTPAIKNAPVVTTPPVTNNVTPPAGTQTQAAPAEAPSIFSMKDSTQYYFVVNVSTNTTNMAPSRFGIGQFNRANLPQGTPVKHDLKLVADHQLIFVGRFSSLTNVKAYARAIVPLLPNIMKVPADKYTFFIITKDNLDKLADKKTLDSYIDFYQKHY